MGLIPDREADERRGTGPVSGTGPLYVVKECPVFYGPWDKVYSESELQPFDHSTT